MAVVGVSRGCCSTANPFSRTGPGARLAFAVILGFIALSAGCADGSIEPRVVEPFQPQVYKTRWVGDPMTGTPDGGFVAAGPGQGTIGKYDASAALVWSTPLAPCMYYALTCVMSVDDEGSVYAPTSAGLNALSPLGTRRWTASAANGMVVAIGPRDKVYAVDIPAPGNGGIPNTSIYAIDKISGAVLWRTSRADLRVGQLMLDPAKNNLYSVSVGRLSALDAESGVIKWMLNMESGPTSAPYPALGADGTIYVPRGGPGGIVLQAVSPDGATRWTTPLDTLFTVLGPVIDRDGTIYVGHGASSVTALRPDGSVLWRYRAPAGSRFAYTAPVVDGERNVFFVMQDPRTVAAVFAVRNGVRGPEITQANPGHGVAFLLSSKGRVFVRANEELIYFDSEGFSAGAVWPMVGGGAGRAWKQGPK